MTVHVPDRRAPEPVVIPSWLRSLVLAGLVLVALVDLGGPVVLRVQLDATAGGAVASGLRAHHRGGGPGGAEAAVRAEVEADGATLEHVEVLPDGRITATVTKPADSRWFDGVSQLDSWYLVRVTTTSAGDVL